MLPSLYYEFTISSLFGGKNAGCLSLHHFNWCICSLFLTLPPTVGFNDPGWEISGSLLKMMLICSIIWLESGCCGLLFCGFCSSLTWGCPVFSVADLYCSKLFTLLMQINDYDTAVYRWLFDVVWWPPRTLWYVDDNHYHFTSFRCRYQKKHRRE